MTRKANNECRVHANSAQSPRVPPVQVGAQPVKNLERTKLVSGAPFSIARRLRIMLRFRGRGGEVVAQAAAAMKGIRNDGSDQYRTGQAVPGRPGPPRGAGPAGRRGAQRPNSGT